MWFLALSEMITGGRTMFTVLMLLETGFHTIMNPLFWPDIDLFAVIPCIIKIVKRSHGHSLCKFSVNWTSKVKFGNAAIEGGGIQIPDFHSFTMSKEENLKFFTCKWFNGFRLTSLNIAIIYIYIKELRGLKKKLQQTESPNRMKEKYWRIHR